MNISNRGHNVPPSPIRKLVPFADLAKASGVQVHHLNIGQPDVETPQVFFDRLGSFPESVVAYGHSAGLLELREAMAAYYRRVGYSVTVDHVTVTIGGSEAILFALMAICDPGDEVICFEPFYTNYNGFAIAAAVTLRPLRCDPDDAYHLPSREVIAASIGPRTRAILVCSPNNPTGTVLRRDELQMLVKLAQEHQLFVISDEAYREFVYGEVAHTGVLDFPQIADRAVLMDSLSKRYSLCGGRVGCLVTHNKELQRAFLHLGQARLCPPSVEQHAAIGLLPLSDSYFGKVQQEYRLRRDTVMRGLEAIPGVRCHTPEGAFYVMARIGVRDAGHFAQWLLTDFRLHNETVMLAPGDGFYATPGLGHDEVRIAYVLQVDHLRRAMQCLHEGLMAYRQRSHS
jgi:aspartate aminotransferase